MLRRQGLPRVVPVCDTLVQALVQARSRPGLLRERLGLAPTLQAVPTVRGIVVQVGQRWQLGG